MISVTTAVATLLAAGDELYLADLYSFFLATGQVLRYTSADQDLSFGGNTWAGSALRIERGKIKVQIGATGSELSVTCYPASTDLVGGNPFLQLAVAGGLDGCYVQLDRAVGPSPFQPLAGIVPKRAYGRVCEMQAGRSKAVFTIKSDLDLLNIQMPRVLFQAPCAHSLYDGGCTLSKAAFTVTGTVTPSGATKTQFITSLTQADSYFNSGVIAFTSGPNTGITRNVRSYLHSAGTVQLGIPLPKDPAGGDAFSIVPGCDKSMATCTGRFNNLVNYRGFPYTPNPEISLL